MRHSQPLSALTGRDWASSFLPFTFCLLPWCAAAHAAEKQAGDAKPPIAFDVKARGPKTFYIDDRAGNNQVSIFSESTVEDFTVVCNRVGGEYRFDPGDVESFADTFFLHVRDLKSGIELRDTHMVGPDWLDAAKHPDLIIKISKVEDVKKDGPTTATMTMIGTCTLHGVTNNIRIPASLAYLEESPKTMRRVKGDLIRIRANFDLKLSDYKITGPAGSDYVGLKVADKLAIKVTIFGSTERPLQPLRPDQAGGTTQPATASASQPAGADSPRRPPPPRPTGQ